MATKTQSPTTITGENVAIKFLNQLARITVTTPSTSYTDLSLVLSNNGTSGVHTPYTTASLMEVEDPENWQNRNTNDDYFRELEEKFTELSQNTHNTPRFKRYMSFAVISMLELFYSSTGRQRVRIKGVLHFIGAKLLHEIIDYLPNFFVVKKIDKNDAKINADPFITKTYHYCIYAFFQNNLTPQTIQKPQFNIVTAALKKQDNQFIIKQINERIQRYDCGMTLPKLQRRVQDLNIAITKTKKEQKKEQKKAQEAIAQANQAKKDATKRVETEQALCMKLSEETIKQIKTNAKNDIEATKKKARKAEAKAQKAEAKADAAERRARDAEAEAQVQNQRNINLRNENVRINTQFQDQLDKRQKEQENAIQQLNVEKTQLQQRNNSFASAYKIIQEDYQGALNTIKEQTNALEKLRQTNTLVKTKNKTLTENIQISKTHNNRLETEIGETNKTNEQYVANIQTLHNENTELRKTTTESNKAQQELQKNLIECQQEKTATENNLKEITQLNRTQQNEIAEKQAAIQDLQQDLTTKALHLQNFLQKIQEITDGTDDSTAAAKQLIIDILTTNIDNNTGTETENRLNNYSPDEPLPEEMNAVIQAVKKLQEEKNDFHKKAKQHRQQYLFLRFKNEVYRIQYRGRLNNIIQKYNDCRNEIKNLRGQIQKKVEEYIAQHRSNIQTIKTELTELEKKKEELERQVKQTEKQLYELQLKKNSLDKQLRQKQIDLDQQQKQLDQKQQQLDQQQLRLDQQEKQNIETAETTGKLVQQLENLKSEYKKKKAEFKTLKAQAAAAKQTDQNEAQQCREKMKKLKQDCELMKSQFEQAIRVISQKATNINEELQNKLQKYQVLYTKHKTLQIQYSKNQELLKQHTTNKAILQTLKKTLKTKERKLLEINEQLEECKQQNKELKTQAEIIQQKAAQAAQAAQENNEKKEELDLLRIQYNELNEANKQLSDKYTDLLRTKTGVEKAIQKIQSSLNQVLKRQQQQQQQQQVLRQQMNALGQEAKKCKQEYTELKQQREIKTKKAASVPRQVRVETKVVQVPVLVPDPYIVFVDRSKGCKRRKKNKTKQKRKTSNPSKSKRPK